MKIRHSSAAWALVLTIGSGWADQIALALPLALSDVSAATLPLAKAVRFDEPAGEVDASRAAGTTPAAPAGSEQCRGSLLLDGPFSETHWILATRYAFAGRPQVARGLTQTAPAATSAADRFDLGRRLAAEGRYDAAQRELEEVVKLDPSGADAHLALADCHRLRGDVVAAEAVLKQAVAELPNDPRPAFQLGELYVLQGQGDAALGYFMQLAVQGPDTWAAKKRVAELLLELGKVSEAAQKIYELLRVKGSDLELIALHARMVVAKGDGQAGTHQLEEVLGQDYTLVRPRFQLVLANMRAGKAMLAAAGSAECLRHEPDFLPARYALAQLHLQAGQYDLAYEQAARVRAALPNSYDVRILASDIARGRGETEVARQIAEQLVCDAPERCDAYYRLGRARAALHQYGKAQSDLERALEMSPTSVAVLAELVDVMRAAHRPDAEVVRRVRAHAEAHPNVAAAQLLLGQLLIASGDSAGATAVLEGAARADPRLLRASYLLGEVYARQGQLMESRQRFAHVAERAPTIVAAQMMLALIDDAEGKHDEAIKRYERVLVLDPAFAPAANNLAWAYVDRADKLDLAVEHARKAQAELPDDPYVADTLGWLMYRQRLFDSAIRYLKDAALALPDRAEVRYHLGMAYRRNNNVEPARTELRAALRIGGFAGAEEAQRAFNEIDW